MAYATYATAAITSPGRTGRKRRALLKALQRCYQTTGLCFVSGDSTTTESTNSFVMQLTLAFAELYDHCPQSGFVHPNTVANGPGTYGLCESTMTGASSESVVYPSTHRLPDDICRVLTNASSYHLAHLGVDNRRANYLGARNYAQVWDTSENLYARFFAGTNTGSSEVAWNNMPTNAHVITTGASIVASGTATLGLDAAAGVVKSGLSPALSYGGLTYPQVRVRGSAAGDLHYMGLWFETTDNPAGIGVVGASSGGYGYHGAGQSSLLGTHANCGPVVTAMAEHRPVVLVLLMKGRNNFFQVSPMTTETMYASCLEEMAWWRQYCPNSEVFFLAVSDEYRDQGTAPQYAEADEQAGAYEAIAAIDDHFFTYNLRLAADKYCGFNAAGESRTGISDEGAWATATAYVAGDVVYTGADASAHGSSVHSRRYWRCRTGQDHTSDVAVDFPGTSRSIANNGYVRWEPIFQHRIYRDQNDVIDEIHHKESWNIQRARMIVRQGLVGEVALARSSSIILM